MIKALIFDFAGVIGIDAYWVWLEEHVPDFAFQRGYFQAIADQVDRAEIPNQAFVRLIAERTGRNMGWIYDRSREGGDAEPFLFWEDDRFVDFFLELMGETATGEQIAQTIETFRQILLL